MVQPMCAEEYQQTRYYAHRRGDQALEHCIGNSCDNLVALATGAPAANWVPETRFCPPAATAPKPGRSDPPEAELSSAVAPPLDTVSSRPAASAGAALDEADGYYDVLRRRSLDEHKHYDECNAEMY